MIAEIKLRAERRAGELIGEMPKQRPGEYQRSHDVTVAPSLADIGITKMQSSRFQAVASLRSTVHRIYFAAGVGAQAHATNSHRHPSLQQQMKGEIK